MHRARLAGIVSAAILALTVSGLVFAVEEFDQNVTPDVIFGDGNANGAFTTERGGGLEIGLRGKLRFDGSCMPQDVFNSNGDGTYSFPAGVAMDGGGNCSSPETPVWSFEWTVNTDFDDSAALNLDAYAYEIGLDFDPSVGTAFCAFDHVTPGVVQPFWDHAIGDNSTLNGDGATAGDAGTYTTLLANNNVGQNSWRYDFFDGGAACGPFDPAADATYDVYLRVLDKGTGQEIARGTVQFIIGAGGPPQLPMTGVAAMLALFAMLAISLAFVVRRLRRTA